MLKRVSIQNFKSLKDVTLDLQKVNLLIGPNNSGKTNFLKALEFYDLYVSRKVEFSEQIVFNRNKSNIVKISLSFEPEGDSYYFQHFSIERDPESYTVRRNNEDIQIKLTKSETLDSSKYGLTLLPRDRANFALTLHLGRAIVYKPDPNKIILPGPVGLGDHLLNADASNIVGFLDLMLSRYRRTVFSQIESDLQKCIPEFVEINLDDVKPTDDLIGNYGRTSFKRIGLFSNIQNITYWSDELSEGTLYFLALLCIINQPNPPKLLLLEEPEKGIHPRRIEEVINFIFALVEDKNIQVIMTTHSPIVVDMFKDLPESVFIFDKDAEEGATNVKNLYTEVIQPETEESKRLGIDPPQYLNGLGEAWKVGFLGGVPR